MNRYNFSRNQASTVPENHPFIPAVISPHTSRVQRECKESVGRRGVRVGVKFLEIVNWFISHCLVTVFITLLMVRNVYVLSHSLIDCSYLGVLV